MGEWCSHGHVTKMAVVTKKLLFGRRRGGLWCDWFLPQLQVGGALRKHHMAGLSSDHVDQLGVPDPGLSVPKSAHRGPAFILHNSSSSSRNTLNAC